MGGSGNRRVEEKNLLRPPPDEVPVAEGEGFNGKVPVEEDVELLEGEVHANKGCEGKVDKFEAADVERATSSANCRASAMEPAAPGPSRGEASRPEEERVEGEEKGTTAMEALPNRPQQHSDAKKSAMPPNARKAPATA